MRCKKDSAGILIPFEYEMETHHSDMHLQAELNAIKPPMMVGGWVCPDRLQRIQLVLFAYQDGGRCRSDV